MQAKQLTVITNSELQTFRDCPKKWGFAYSESLRPRTTPKALSFGTAFHSATEILYRTLGTVPHDEVIEIATEQGLGAIKSRLAQWVTECEDDPSVNIEHLYVEAEDAVATATWAFTNYIRTFRADIARLVPVGVELPFSVFLRNVRGRTLPGVVHAGVVDLIAYDPAYGDLVVYDHKTTSGEIGSVDRRVEIDPQIAGYLNALVEVLRSNPESLADCARTRIHHPHMAEAVASLEAGKSFVGRIAYNVVRKKRPSEPKVNKNGMVSVAQCDTLPEYYRAALESQERDRGKAIVGEQIEFLDRLIARGDTFIGRREFFRTSQQIEEWRAETFEQARLVRAAERDVSLRYRNPGHCSMPWSMPCSYRSICLDNAPELRQGFITVPRHREVEEARRRETAGSTED